MEVHCGQSHQFFIRRDMERGYTKSSLKYINLNKVKVGQSHPVWATVRDNVYDSRKAQTKCRLLTSTYTLQRTGQSLTNTLWVDPTCKLCRNASETRQHFLVYCQALSDERGKCHSQVGDRLDIDLSCPDTVTLLIMDPSIFAESFPDNTELALHSRELIDTLRRKRIKLLVPHEGQQGLAVSSLMFPNSESVPADQTNVLFLTSDNEFSGIIYSLFRGKQNIFLTRFSTKFIVKCATKKKKKKKKKN